MKKYIRLLPLVFIFLGLALLSLRCSKSTSPNCTGVFCTEIFASVGVYVDDLTMTPVGITVYTIRNSTGEKLTFTQNNMNGIYTVVDDTYRKNFAGRTEQFTLVGSKSGVEVFRDTLLVKADCCHVSKVSGRDSLTIPIH